MRTPTIVEAHAWLASYLDSLSTPEHVIRADRALDSLEGSDLVSEFPGLPRYLRTRLRIAGNLCWRFFSTTTLTEAGRARDEGFLRTLFGTEKEEESHT